MVVADRNILTIKPFSELQDHCFKLKITLIPVGNVSELPHLLVQMVTSYSIFVFWIPYCMHMQIWIYFVKNFQTINDRYKNGDTLYDMHILGSFFYVILL